MSKLLRMAQRQVNHSGKYNQLQERSNNGIPQTVFRAVDRIKIPASEGRQIQEDSPDPPGSMRIRIGFVLPDRILFGRVRIVGFGIHVHEN